MAEGEWVVIWMDRWLDWERLLGVLEYCILLVRNRLSNNIWAHTLKEWQLSCLVAPEARCDPVTAVGSD